ncbi:MAG: hypothetical protein C1943_16965 [Halochromatium sp.]|nr:hypothetical protein [Halochromatium sp.]
MNRTLVDLPSARSEIIAIASQKGGVGKSTTALNLSMALVAAGRTVLLIDLDPNGHAGDTLMSGVHAGGTERILREATLSADMITATEIPDLFLAPAGPGLGSVESDLALAGDHRTRLHQALATLPSLPWQFDHVVLDCPPAVGLLTLNALAAAHKILLPIPCESQVLAGLPTLLKTISRLRAGLKQPLHGVYLLVVQRVPSTSVDMLVRTLRQEHGGQVLLTEIPLGDAVREAAERGKPLLAHCLHCDVSQAYLQLAAEWLLEQRESQDKTDSKLGKSGSFRARQESMSNDCDAMRQRIQAWLMDPSSLLYDETWETERQQDALVFEELFHQEPPKRRLALLVLPLFLLLLALFIILVLQFWFPDTLWWNRQEVRLPVAETPLPPNGASRVNSDESAERDGSIEQSERDGDEAAEAAELAEQAQQDEAPKTTAQADPAERASVEESGGLNQADEQIDEQVDEQPETSAADGPDQLLHQDGEDRLGDLEEREVPKPSEPESSEPKPVAESPAVGQGKDPAPLTPHPDIIVVDPPPRYRWQVQLLAGRSLERVQQDSQKFLAEYAADLGDKKLIISQSGFGDARDAFYRLRALEWGSKAEAAAWCDRLRRRGQSCFAVRVITEGD